ncbi:ubiquinone biosynthesis regulatory protein kinase UbiB [Aquisalimonas lutea]|uniref:ubiquinone biosynthesis regulatory protein kinase UbiB n=1 Tax=Aquisalimonas lutea TaxID=1327750 RepID=UPI0025B2B704|nr:ubiquinone biosynthesis regulatory protein kinase UbiB [Aquisalimonas lutea]MDN3516644.1 ubiquinone biosynthesis regulatory protein kinase UbiB [Aquisalimonas lutea]
MIGRGLRLIRINWVLVKYGLDDVILATRLFRPLRWTRYFMPWNWVRRQRGTRGERIRQALEELGPIFVKFGQILSTRSDLLPPDVAMELARLQDRVPPFPATAARAIIEQSYERPLSEAFARFDDTPIASASIAQVHGARLWDGEEVVVKVVRPDIQPVIRRDLDLLYTFAALTQRYWPPGRRLRPREVVAEFEKTLIDELDLMREAANASQLRRNFEDSRLLYIPAVHFHLTTDRVMVMERISGVPVNHMERLRAEGVDMRRLAEKGVEIFFTQVFRDSFFHADMHPGNIFVDTTQPEDPQYVAVDFGIVGSLGPVDHRYLAENFLAFFNRDYRRVAELHVESGWVPAGTRVEEFEAAMRTVCEPIFERPLREISFGALLMRLFQTGRRFDMEIQPQLVLLQKTLLNIEGLGRQLYPELDLWRTAKPYMERWMRSELGVGAVIRNVRRELPHWGEELPRMPQRLLEALEALHDTRRQMDEQRRELQALRHAVHRNGRRREGTTVGVLLVAGGVLLHTLATPLGPVLAGIAAEAWAVGTAGLVVLAVAWLRR